MYFDKLFEKLTDLPVAQIADDVALSVLTGDICILESATGSGKTLYGASSLAELASQNGEMAVVLVPRRFLAVNAAETVAELAECEIGGPVGYAVGNQSGDKSCWGVDTKLLYATYGYALASGLVWSAKVIVLDEVHETSLDMSIVRALLQLRRKRGEDINILEMSATINTMRQAAYWESVGSTRVFSVDGKTFRCERRHRPASKVEDEVMNLLEEGRQGILVFRPGVGEVEETANAISTLAQAAGLQIEVSQIYGEMGYAERAEATRAPQDNSAKVLVGTNVVESGANIAWLDSGVTCGTGKENSVRPVTGATYLALQELPQWRLEQQEGRIKRFGPGIFTLCSPLAFEQRPKETRPEIERLALTELVMHCASFKLRAHELTFDYAPDPSKVEEAEKKLQHLGLIDENCALTPAGTFVSGLPVGPETGAMLWHATRTQCLSVMIPLAAVIETGGVRKDFRHGHYLDRDSDWIDGLKAFAMCHQAHDNRNHSRREIMQDHNVGYKRFEAVRELLRDLERRLNTESSLEFEGGEEKLRRCILAGSLDRLYQKSSGYRGELVSIRNRLNEYNIGQGSCVQYVPQGMYYVAGDLRVITPRDRSKAPFTILQEVTVFSLDDIKAVAKLRPGILTSKVETQTGWGAGSRAVTTFLLFGEDVLAQTSEIVGLESNTGSVSPFRERPVSYSDRNPDFRDIFARRPARRSYGEW